MSSVAGSQGHVDTTRRYQTLSGYGAEGIRKYCRQKTFVVDRFGLKTEFNWFPLFPIGVM